MKRIWFEGADVEAMGDLSRDTMVEHLGIELLEAGPDHLKGRMPVDRRTRQPAGVLHGGASVAFAETLASWAASHCVDPATHHIVGLEINANHVRSVADGWVYGTARPMHLGRTTQVWEIRITDEADRLVCASRITIAVLHTPGRYRGTETARS